MPGLIIIIIIILLLLLLLLLLLFTAIEFSLGGSSSYTSAHKTNKNKCT
jgi:flagellar basal body-associated protein FliL